VLSDLFRQDAQRAATFSVEAAGLFLDFSKNHLQRDTLDLLPERDATALLLAGKRARPKAEPKTVLSELLPQRLAL
jgi:predicted flavoprotein YhiN